MVQTKTGASVPLQKALKILKSAQETLQNGDVEKAKVILLSLNNLPQKLEDELLAAIREESPYTQESYSDIQPDGTINYKNTTSRLNKSQNPISTNQFMNSDFVKITSMHDEQGNPLKYKETHRDNHYYYKVTLNEPVAPGKPRVMTHAGTINGLIKPLDNMDGVYQYYMRHSPNAGEVTRRIETYLLPEGAELISTTPPSIQRTEKDGRIQLHLEEMIPGNGSITTAFQYKLGKASSVKKIDSSKLQSLIDNAKEGSTVTVPEGVYTEPIKINKAITLIGSSRDKCVFEVTANEPAIMVDLQGGKGSAVVSKLTIKWQLATSDKGIESPFAVGVKDGKAHIIDCAFRPLGDYKRSPVAIRSSGFAVMNIQDCDFEGFEYTVCYGEGTSGYATSNYIANSGHQGIICYSGARLKLTENIITGSKFHAVRNTGGTLSMKSNLIINNAGRGVYLGNKSGTGTITNNLVIGNEGGIAAFGHEKYDIRGNIIMGSIFAGIVMDKSCSLKIGNNIFMNNPRGWALSDRGESGKNTYLSNTFWNNKVDTENFDNTVIGKQISEQPQFRDAAKGDFSLTGGEAKEERHGLIDAETIWKLWKKYEKRQGGIDTSAKNNQEDGPDLGSPEATIKSFMKAVYDGNVDAVMACVSIDGVDYDDIREMMTTKSNHPIRDMIKAMDTNIDINIVKTSMAGDGLRSIVWLMTFGRDFHFGEKLMKKGTTYELDGNLKLFGDKWMIIGI